MHNVIFWQMLFIIHHRIWLHHWLKVLHSVLSSLENKKISNRKYFLFNKTYAIEIQIMFWALKIKKYLTGHIFFNRAYALRIQINRGSKEWNWHIFNELLDANLMYNMISKICIQLLGQNVLSTTFYIYFIKNSKR